MRKMSALIVTICVLGGLLSWAFRTKYMVIATAVIVVTALVVYARVIGRRRSFSNGLYWRGVVSFREADLLGNPDLFPDISYKHRRGGWGRRRLCAGWCEVQSTGIKWESGTLATPDSEVSGRFVLPWSAVDDARTSRLRWRKLGGEIILTLSEDRGELGGEFIGSLSGLSGAFASTAAIRRRHRPKTTGTTP
jgi:hypothetical protein